LNKYGPDTAFFTTSFSHLTPILKQVLKYGGYSLATTESAPLIAFPEVLGIDKGLITDWPASIKTIEEAVLAAEAGGRLSTWGSSLNESHLKAVVEFSVLVAKGQAKKNDTEVLLECYDHSSPGVKWTGFLYSNPEQQLKDNVFLVYQDTYIFGHGYLGATEIPEKYQLIKYPAANLEPVRNYHLAIVTGDAEQGAEDVIGAQDIVRRYGSVENGGLISHVMYPNQYIDDPELTAALIEGLLSDPLVKVIVVNQAIGGTAEGFKRVKAKNPEVICLSGEPYDPPEEISREADLVVAADFISRGYLLPFAAKKLGAKNFVHISFERHMEYEPLLLRSLIMEEACKDLELNFYSQTAPDPIGELGVEGAQQFILEAVPKWLEQYGKETAFFATNDAHTEPLLRKLAQYGGYFIEADIPSALLGYPGAFNLDLNPYLGQWNLLLEIVEEEVIKAGGTGRLGTWAYPLGFSQTAGLAEFGILMADGETNASDINTLLTCLGIFSPGAHWNGSYLNDLASGKPLRNYFLIYQDTYIFGKGFIATTKEEIPDKYYRITLNN
jgi:hypothetical protein